MPMESFDIGGLFANFLFLWMKFLTRRRKYLSQYFSLFPSGGEDETV